MLTLPAAIVRWSTLASHLCLLLTLAWWLLCGHFFQLLISWGGWTCRRPTWPLGYWTSLPFVLLAVLQCNHGDTLGESEVEGHLCHTLLHSQSSSATQPVGWHCLHLTGKGLRASDPLTTMECSQLSYPRPIAASVSQVSRYPQGSITAWRLRCTSNAPYIFSDLNLSYMY